MTHFNILKQEGRKTLCLFLLVIPRLSVTAEQQKTASCIILLVFQLSLRRGRERKGREALYRRRGSEERGWKRRGGKEIESDESEVPRWLQSAMIKLAF